MTQPVSELVASVVINYQSYSVESLALTFDESWAPYAAVTLTLPYSSALAAATDPRNYPRLLARIERRWFGSLTLANLSTAWAGLTLAGLTTQWAGLTLADLTTQWGLPWDSGLRVPDVVQANLGIRSREIDYQADTITLQAASDELVAQDYVLGGLSLPVESLPNRLYRLLAQAGITFAYTDFAAGAIFVAMPAEVTSWSENYWAAMSRMANSCGLRLWCDEARVWHLIDVNAAPTSSATISRVTSARDTTNRDGKFANAIVWNGTGIQSGGASLTDSKQRPLVFPASPRVAVINHDYGQVGAGIPMPTDQELDSRLALLASQARTLTLTAPADPTVRPSMTLNTGLPSLPTLAAIAARVEWDIPRDVMTITTRATT